jgi:hypothetical protein
MSLMGLNKKVPIKNDSIHHRAIISLGLDNGKFKGTMSGMIFR